MKLVRSKFRLGRLILTTFKDEDLLTADETINVDATDIDATSTKNVPPGSYKLVPASF